MSQGNWLSAANRLDTYRRILRLTLMLSLMIALSLILIGVYYLLATGR
jgi:hypothetical protein